LKQAISYWDGMDTYIYDYSGKDGAMSYQVIPTTNDGMTSQETCWITSTPASTTPIVLFPDFSTFTAMPDQHTVNGHLCNGWILEQPEFNSTSGNIGTYWFYADASTNTPVRYQVRMEEEERRNRRLELTLPAPSILSSLATTLLRAATSTSTTSITLTSPRASRTILSLTQRQFLAFRPSLTALLSQLLTMTMEGGPLLGEAFTLLRTMSRLLTLKCSTLMGSN
jgi:hypothetical protein